MFEWQYFLNLRFVSTLSQCCCTINPYKPGFLFIGHRQNAASHLGLFCLLAQFSSKNEMKTKKKKKTTFDAPKTKMDSSK